jgi:hypothetical protein
MQRSLDGRAGPDGHRQPRPGPLRRAAAVLLALAGCDAPPEPAPPPPPPAIEQPPATSTPVFAIGLWPGEGRPEFDATGAALPLRIAPLPESPSPDTLRPTAGQRIAYDSTSYQTIGAAAITVLRADTIRGRDFGAISVLSRAAYDAGAVPSVRVPVDPGSRVELLQHRAEGGCFVRIEERVLEADPCPLFDVGAFRPEAEPRTAWWIFIGDAARRQGWVLVTDSTVVLAGRRF